MQELGAFEAKNTLGALLDRVQRGEEIVITRHGSPVALLVPVAGGITRLQARAASDRIRARARAVDSPGFDWEILKAEKDAGRP